MERYKDMDKKLIAMEVFIKGNGKMDKCMDKENIFIKLMDGNIMEILRIIGRMGLGP